jgi:hypothetical protein
MSMRNDPPAGSPAISLDPFERLNRLSVARSCGASWETMEGHFSQRHCARCEKQVHDFRRLTAQEIEQRIRSHSSGGICARLTHGPDGALVYQSTPLPEAAPPSSRTIQRANPAAAYLLTALLGAATASAQAPTGDEAGIDASRKPEDRLDPLDFPNAPPEGPAIESADEDPYAEASGTFEVTMGVLAPMPDPFYSEFAASPLVVLATVGRTKPVEPVDPDDGYFEVESELEIESLLRGEAGPEGLRLRYPVTTVDAGGDKPRDTTAYPEGTTLLAFLEPTEGNGSAPGVWQARREPLVLTDDEVAAYSDRLEALAALVGPDGQRELAPADLVEWLVGTVEESATRGAAIDDLAAVAYVDLSEGQRARLVQALVGSATLGADEIQLCARVLDWAPAEADAWLLLATRDLALSGAAGSADEALATLDRVRQALGLLEEGPLVEGLEAVQNRVSDIYERIYAGSGTVGEDERSALEGRVVALVDEALLDVAAGLERRPPRTLR